MKSIVACGQIRNTQNITINININQYILADGTNTCQCQESKDAQVQVPLQSLLNEQRSWVEVHLKLKHISEYVWNDLNQLQLKNFNYHYWLLDWFWYTYRNFGENIQNHGQNGKIGSYPLSTKTFHHVFRQSTDLKIKSIEKHMNYHNT